MKEERALLKCPRAKKSPLNQRVRTGGRTWEVSQCHTLHTPLFPLFPPPSSFVLPFYARKYCESVSGEGPFRLRVVSTQ